MKKHRDWQKRIIFEDACYFVTSKTHNNYPYFRERIFCELFVENLKLCKQLKGFLLYGWVIIYDHIHLLFQPSDGFDISKVMQYLKRHVSRNLNIVMGYTKLLPPPEGGIGQSHLRDGCLSIDEYHNLIQKLYKFDIFVRILTSRFRIKYPNKNPYPKFQWKESFHDHYIRNDWDFNDKMEYIAWNPDKHGLPTDWPYVYTNPDYEDLIDEC